MRYRCAPRRGLYFMGPDAAHPDRPLQCWTQGQDDDSRYYWPCLDPDREGDDGDHLHRARRQLRAVERRAARAPELELPGGKQIRWHYALDFPHPPYLVTLVCGPSSRSRTARAAPASTSTTSCRRGARPTRAAASAARRRSSTSSRRSRHPLPALALQPDRRARLHLRRHGEHLGDHADRSRAARRARGDRPRRRGAGLARAGAPVVGRPGHLPRVVRGLAQRRVRDLLRVRLARARTRGATRPTSSCSPTPRVT